MPGPYHPEPYWRTDGMLVEDDLAHDPEFCALVEAIDRLEGVMPFVPSGSEFEIDLLAAIEAAKAQLDEKREDAMRRMR